MLESKLNALYERFGYRKFKMSKFEPYDFYAENRAFLTSSQIIAFTDLDGSLLALKPDVTLSIVKANGGGEEKLYYNEMVYRPKDRHYREIQQVGIECIGRMDAYTEGEAIALAAKSLQLFSEEYVIRISDAQLLKDFLGGGERDAAWDLPEAAVQEILRLFAAKNTAGIREMRDGGQLPGALAELLCKLADLYRPFQDSVDFLEEGILPELLAGCGAGPGLERKLFQRLSKFRRLSAVLAGFSVLPHIYMDFSIVNSMDYYTGILFQGALREVPFVVLSGGRYDGLMEKMGRRLGAIGFALYLDTIEDYAALPGSREADLLIHYAEEEAGQLPAVVERFQAEGKQVRVVRSDALGCMEQSIRAGRTVSLRELLAEMDFGKAERR